MIHLKRLHFFSRAEIKARVASASGYYVYVLARPDDSPFYVGKGNGARVLQHEAEAINTLLRSHKLNLIRKILSEGSELRYSIAGWFEDEREALALERRLIAAIGRYDLGLGPLTNQTDGGEGPSNPSIESKLRHRATLGGQAEDPERRAINEFFASIAGNQSSVPIKPLASWKRAEPLRSSVKKIFATERMARAIVATAAANGLLLAPGVRLPRLLELNGAEYLIENGCGREMIKAGLVRLESETRNPREDVLVLTDFGFDYVRRMLTDRRLIDLAVLAPDGDASTVKVDSEAMESTIKKSTGGNEMEELKIGERARSEETGLSTEPAVRGKRESETYWNTRNLTYQVTGSYYRTPQANLELLKEYVNEHASAMNTVLKTSFAAPGRSNLNFALRSGRVVRLDAHGPITKEEFLRELGIA